MRILSYLIVGGIVVCVCLLLFPTMARCQSPWPFDPAPLTVLQQSNKKVFAHYMTQFPISLDNQDPTDDKYVRSFFDPNGEQGKHRPQGGFLRERPIPRAPLGDK